MNFWEELAQARIEEEVPKGWLTVKEIAKEMNKGETQAWRIVKKAMEEGKVEMRPFRILRSGVVRPIPHYRQISPKSQPSSPPRSKRVQR